MPLPRRSAGLQPFLQAVTLCLRSAGIALLSLLRFLLRRAASMKLCARWHGGGGARHKGSGVHVTRMETVKQAESREGKEAEEELG